MAQKIDAQYLEQIGGAAALDEQIKLFQAALAKHAKTENVPAPTAHPAVERIVRHHGGKYEVVASPEPPPPPKPDPVKSRPVHIDDINAEAQRRIYAIAPEHEQRNSLARIGLGKANELDRWMWPEIDRLRARAKALKAKSPLSDDYADDRHWAR